METWCDRCPYPGRFCKGTIFPDRCEAIAGGDPGGRTTRAVAPPRSAPAIPLAGDVVEVIAAKLGADKLARKWEELTGLDCGCADRKAWLNRKSEELLRWAGMIG